MSTIHQGTFFRRGLWRSPSGVLHGRLDAWPETACGRPVADVGSGWRAEGPGDATCKACAKVWRVPMPR